MSHPKKDGKMDHQKDGSETKIISPDVEAFINLVDREAQLFALRNENNQIQEKNQVINGIGWQPTFEIQDFDIPSGRKQNTNPGSELPDLLQTLAKGGGASGDKREETLKMGTKRRRDWFGSSSNESPERANKKIPSNGFPHDLNKNGESSDLWNFWQKK